MSLIELAFALLALLLSPGPTNTLMAVSGAGRGLAGTARLVPYEIAAYLAVTVPLALVGGAAMEAVPGLRAVVTVLSGLWVMVLALKMWRLPAPGSTTGVTGRAVFITTLLNPKALIIGAVLLPGDPILHRALLFAVLIPAVAMAWAAIGACMAARSDCPIGQTPPLLRRIAGLWLGFLSVGLLMNGLS